MVTNRWYLAAECCVLFVLLPALLTVRALHLPKLLVLLVVTIGCVIILRQYPSFNYHSFWDNSRLRQYINIILLRFAIFMLLSIVAVWFFEPRNLWSTPRHRPLLWLLILILYPIVSAYPQEIIFRGFFFQRYRPLFHQTLLLAFASIVCFGYLHILYQNWVAILLATIGGAIYTWTYMKTRSISVAALEHSLYGAWIFTVGFGHYFFRGFS